MAHNIRRMLIEFEQDDGKVFEAEVKDILPTDSKFEMQVIHDPNGSGRHYVVMEARVMKRSKAAGGSDVIYTLREVRGT